MLKFNIDLLKIHFWHIKHLNPRKTISDVIKMIIESATMHKIINTIMKILIMVIK